MKKSAYNEAKTAGVLTKQIAKKFIAKGLSSTTAESTSGYRTLRWGRYVRVDDASNSLNLFYAYLCLSER